jgi:hypothetical protein
MNNENIDIDRSPPIAVFLSGESFFHSARYLRGAIESGDLRLRFSMPVYYLYSHALELTLKSFLRSKGMSSSRLASREFGHKLQALWDACVAEGLKSNPITEASIAQAVDLLDPFASDFEFRYVKTGLKNLPTLDTVESVVRDLMKIVRPYCEKTIRS